MSQYKNKNSRTNIFISCATTFFSTIKYITVQQYVSQYRKFIINFSTKITFRYRKIFFKKIGKNR